MVIQTHSATETIRTGKNIGSRLRSGDVVALVGELGQGKPNSSRDSLQEWGLGTRLIFRAPLLH